MRWEGGNRPLLFGSGNDPCLECAPGCLATPGVNLPLIPCLSKLTTGGVSFVAFRSLLQCPCLGNQSHLVAFPFVTVLSFSAHIPVISGSHTEAAELLYPALKSSQPGRALSKNTDFKQSQARKRRLVGGGDKGTRRASCPGTHNPALPGENIYC